VRGKRNENLEMRSKRISFYTNISFLTTIMLPLPAATGLFFTEKLASLPSPRWGEGFNQKTNKNKE
jgi:hypothetical protein